MDADLSYGPPFAGRALAARVEMVRLGAVPAMLRTLHATTELG